MNKLSFLPSAVLEGLANIDLGRLHEIRLRADKSIRVCIDGRFFFLSQKGAASNSTGALICSQNQIAQIVLRAAEHSIYAFNNQLSSGYITIDGGIRIGIAGEMVYEGEKIKTQKNFTSLVIRLPHEIFGCADLAYRSIMRSKNKNTLVISPPGCGKTTLLRDLSRQISDSGFNTLLVDERSELAACSNGKITLDVGANTDIISNARKDYAFIFGIRSLRPDFIVTDELASIDDVGAVKKAALSGVNVIASIHAFDLDDLKKRSDFEGVFSVFGCFITLSGVGKYENIVCS